MSVIENTQPKNNNTNININIIDWINIIFSNLCLLICQSGLRVQNPEHSWLLEILKLRGLKYKHTCLVSKLYRIHLKAKKIKRAQGDRRSRRVGSTGLQQQGGRETRSPSGMQSGGLSNNHRACQLINKNHISRARPRSPGGFGRRTRLA